MLLPYVRPALGSSPIWYPINGAQITALESYADALLYGGASGGGKTDLLVGDAMQESDNGYFRGILIRRALDDFRQISDRCNDVYRKQGAWSTEQGKLWKWPSGATLRFMFVKSDKDWEKFQGQPFSWLGVDEGGHQTERRIRRILPWLVAQTGTGLRRRIRITANPGGIGASWLMNLFLGGKCPIHANPTIIEPGAVYKGTRWSDGKPTLLTTCFVPALSTDNPLYGQEKIDMLRSQEGALADKLLMGCWCELEGAYFPFVKPGGSFQYPIAKLTPQWWWNWFIAIDYGFGNSSAAAGLYCAHPNGRKFKVAEYVIKGRGSVDFAHDIRNMWIESRDHNPEGEKRQIVAIYIDPANDDHRGTGKSNMELMDEVFQESGLSCIKASKGRISNAQALYNALSAQDLVICDTCPKTFESIRTRIHDDAPGRAGDVKKVPGDPLDDIYDETAYAYNNYAPGTDVPQERAALQKLEEYRKDGMDENSLAHHMLKMQMEMRGQEVQPMRIGRGKRMVVRRH